MQFFFTWLISAIVDIVGKNVMTVSARLAFSVLLVSTFVAMAVAYVQGMNTIIQGVSATAPEVVSMAWSWVAPPNTNACFTGIMGARILKFLYVKYAEVVSKKADVLSRTV